MTDHSIMMENRQMLTVTAVTDVKSFDENGIIITLQEGGLNVKGSGLKITQLDLEDGRVIIDGTVNSLVYTHSGAETGGKFLKKMLK